MWDRAPYGPIFSMAAAAISWPYKELVSFPHQEATNSRVNVAKSAAGVEPLDFKLVELLAC